jgi:hypothetical protein
MLQGPLLKTLSPTYQKYPGSEIPSGTLLYTLAVRRSKSPQVPVLLPSPAAGSQAHFLTYTTAAVILLRQSFSASTS